MSIFMVRGVSEPGVLEVHGSDGAVLRHHLAGVGSRGLAYTHDLTIKLILMTLSFLIASVEFSNPMLSSVWLGTFAIFFPVLIGLGYHVFFELIWSGRTPGKRITGIRVISEDGQSATVAQHFIRNFGRIVDFLPVLYGVGILSLMFTDRHVRVGDMMSGCVVIHENFLKRSDANAVNNLSQLADDKAEEYTLLMDLLQAWNGLDRRSRISLGSRYLAKFGGPTCSIPDEHQKERAIYEALRERANQK